MDLQVWQKHMPYYIHVIVATAAAANFVTARTQLASLIDPCRSEAALARRGYNALLTAAFFCAVGNRIRNSLSHQRRVPVETTRPTLEVDWRSLLHIRIASYS